MSKALKTILVICVICCSLLLFACGGVNGDDTSGDKGSNSQGDSNEPQGGSNSSGGEQKNELPEGAIALTKDNLEDYFEIKTTAKCDYNIYEETTQAVAYVAIVPLGDYSTVTGRISFDIDTRVYRWFGIGDYKISNTEQYLFLDNAIVNKNYKLTIQDSYSSSDPFKIKEETVGVTVHSVSGYVIPQSGKNEPNEIESLTEAQIAGSDAVKTEIEELLNNFKSGFDSTRSYTFINNHGYSLFSYYGGDMSKIQKPIGNGFKIDKLNNRFEDSSSKYYSIDEVWYKQWIYPGTNLVKSSKSGLDIDSAIINSQPSWNIIDPNAVYLNIEDGKYVGYVTLKDMEDSVWKEQIKSAFEPYGITTKYDKFIVKYEIGFVDGDFNFYVSIRYYDPKYHVEYVDIRYDAVQRVTALNSSEVKLYDSSEYSFMLADSLEDAAFFKNGLLEIDCKTSKIVYKTFSDKYQNEPYPPYENYLPILIKEGGVYNFTTNTKTITILDENGKVHGYYDSYNYFPAGLYYIRSNYVAYGVTDVIVEVESRIYEDYIDKYSASESITTGDSFTFEFEGNGDRNAVLFTSMDSGIYSFGKHPNISVYVYSADDPEELISEAWGPNLSLYLNGDSSFIIVFECINYGDNTDKLSFTGLFEYIGEVTQSETELGFDWIDVTLFGELSFIIKPDRVGYYYVEYEPIPDDPHKEGVFYDSNEKPYYVYDLILIGDNEVKVYAFDATEYTYLITTSMNTYSRGRMRLVCYEEGISETTDITIKSDEYTTITTSDLNTVYSSSSFKFNLIESGRLLIDLNSDFFALYDENGRRYGTTTYPTYIDTEFNNKETNFISNLKPGNYTIVYTIEHSYSKPGVKTANIRFDPS